MNTVLLGLISSAAGVFFQNRTAQKKKEVEKHAQDLRAANELFEQLSITCSRRLYLSYQVTSLIKDDLGSGEILPIIRGYMDAVTEYNTMRFVNEVKLNKYYGAAIKEYFVRVVHGYDAQNEQDLTGFRLLHSYSKDIMLTFYNKEKLTELQSRKFDLAYRDVSERMVSLFDKMQKLLDSGKIGYNRVTG